MVLQSKPPYSPAEKTQDLLLDVASLPLVIETAGGVMTSLMKRKTTVPKNPKFSPLTLTTNPVCLYKYTKESVLAPRTKTC